MTDSSDSRVYCWHCARRTLDVDVPVPRITHSKRQTRIFITQYRRRRICALDLAYDPFVKRQCEHFSPLPPARIEPFPREYR